MTKTAVLVATYNGEKYLKNQLDTIRDQELKPDFVLFRDDRSSDGTVKFIRNYIVENQLENWLVKINEENIGWRLNFRQLLLDGLTTDADYFFFSDQDNVWKLDKNRCQIEAMETHPQIEVLSADIEIGKTSDDVADLPKWFKYYQFPEGEALSQYPPRKNYSSYRVGWAVVMRRKFVVDLMTYWKPEYNVTHDVIVPVLASLLGTGYNLNQVIGTHLLHDTNATGARLLTLSSPKKLHVEELYKFVGFYDVLYQVLKARGFAQAAEMKHYYDFYVKRYELARENKFFAVFGQILTDWRYYPGMSGRIRDVIFAFKK